MISPVDEIKQKLDIVELVGSYLKLQKAGRNYKACCPFHSEKTPSFMVSPEKQMWHCFGCSKGGSVFDFVMEMEGVEFGDALRTLAQRTGVTLKAADPGLAKQLKTERTRLYEICELAARFFAKQLEAGKTGAVMRKYLAERGLQAQTIKQWRLGYAPSQWRTLVDFLNQRGYPNQEIVKTGLAIRNEQRNSWYDRFRDRIMFPICDLNGAVVGFTGRENPHAPVEHMGKYVNIPNTLIYDKSKALYGLDQAKLGIRNNDLCVLVEGQLDVIMAHQAGSDNVVASSGTALTPHQLKIIKRYTPNLAVAYDMDPAGETAAKRGLELAVQSGFNAKVVVLPGGEDPADCFKNHADIWAKAVSGAVNIVNFYLQTALKKHSPDSGEGKRRISEIVLPVIKQIPNRVEQAHWLQETAACLHIKEDILRAEMDSLKTAQAMESIQLPAEPVRPRSNLEDYTVGLLLACPETLKKSRKKFTRFFEDSEIRQIFECLRNGRKLPAELENKAKYLTLKVEAEKELTNDFDAPGEIAICFASLEKRHLRRQLTELSAAIEEAEKKGQSALIKKLTRDFNELLKQTNG